MKKHLAAAAIGSLLLAPLLLHADPAADQDAQEARQKLLRTADQIDVLQKTVDSQTADLASLKAQLAQARADLDAAKADLASLKADDASLRDSLQKLDAARADQQKVILEKVSEIVASAAKQQAPPPAPVPTPPAPAKSDAPASGLPPAGGTQDGFDYVVVKGDTLHAIAAAYQAHGLHVTVSDIRKANGLSATDTIHVGQKLFIPKK